MVFYDVTSFATHVINCANHLRILDLKPVQEIGISLFITGMHFLVMKRLFQTESAVFVSLIFSEGRFAGSESKEHIKEMK